VEAIREPAPSVLFNPSEYEHLSTLTFQPLLLLSFKADLLLHGLDPRLFYAHQVAALIAGAILLFLLLRRYVRDLYAAVGAGVFLASWVSIYAARTLMIRHYVEGLVFALGALLAWSYGRRWIVAGSVLYLLAMLSKEVYAPIPLLLICQERAAGRSWREIARELVAPSIAAAVFLVWRWTMTGLTGGYASAALGGGAPRFGRAFWNGITGNAPPWAQIVWGLAIAMALGAFLVRTRLRGAAFLAATAIVIALPLVPLIHRFDVRYDFALMAFGLGALTIAAGMSRFRWAVLIPIALLVTTVIDAVPQRRNYETAMRLGMAQEGRYVWTEPPGAPTLFATSPGWYLGSLAWLRQYDHRGSAPPFVFSKYAITADDVDPGRAVAIGPSGAPAPLTSTSIFGTPAEWQRARAKRDPNAPLSVDFSLRNHDARWNLGPPGGRFVFLSVPGYSAISIPAAGAQRVPIARERQYFRIVREAEDGSWTVSPRFPVPLEGGSLTWSRGGLIPH